jgi:hypothetical protein
VKPSCEFGDDKIQSAHVLLYGWVIILLTKINPLNFFL